MKLKILNLVLLLTSFIGYLEWGVDQKMFLIKGEIIIFQKMLINPSEVFHPLIILPFLGQVLLIMSLLWQKAFNYLTYAGMACISLLMLIIFLIGILSLNFKMIASALPFIFTAVWILFEIKKLKIKV
jgi:uncharacterized membrane protein